VENNLIVLLFHTKHDLMLLFGAIFYTRINSVFQDIDQGRRQNARVHFKLAHRRIKIANKFDFVASHLRFNVGGHISGKAQHVNPFPFQISLLGEIKDVQNHITNSVNHESYHVPTAFNPLHVFLLETQVYPVDAGINWQLSRWRKLGVG